MCSKNKVFFLTLFVTIISEDTLLFGTNSNSMFIAIRFVLYIVFLILFFNRAWRHLDKRASIFTFIIIGIIIMTMFINADIRNGYLLQLLGILLALKIISAVRFKPFLENLSKIIYFFSIVSIVFYILISFLPSMLNKLPTISNYAEVDFATILFSNIIKKEGLLRNSSIFREPGIFGIYLIICIIYEFFYTEKINLKRVLIFSISLITTFSTMAFLALGLIIIGYTLYNRNLKSKISVLLCVALFIIFLLPLMSETIFSKFDSDSADFRSTLSRISSIVVPAVMFYDNPFGVGLSDFVSLYPNYSYMLFNVELKPDGEATNTLINTFAVYGLIYGVILLLAVWGLARQYGKPLLITMVIFGCYILIFSSQELRFSLLFNILIMYGLTLRNKNLIYTCE